MSDMPPTGPAFTEVKLTSPADEVPADAAAQWRGHQRVVACAGPECSRACGRLSRTRHRHAPPAVGQVPWKRLRGPDLTRRAPRDQRILAIGSTRVRPASGGRRSDPGFAADGRPSPARRCAAGCRTP